MRESEGYFDPVLLATIAARVRSACRAQRRHQSLSLYLDALLRASVFLDHARIGDLLHRDHTVSSTPALDLSAEDYVRTAAREIYGRDAENGRFRALVTSLSRTLKAASRSGAIRPEDPWKLDSIETLWGHIYIAAEEAAAAPTDEVETRIH
jgi:hypothetical protein